MFPSVKNIQHHVSACSQGPSISNSARVMLSLELHIDLSKTLLIPQREISRERPAASRSSLGSHVCLVVTEPIVIMVQYVWNAFFYCVEDLGPEINKCFVRMIDYFSHKPFCAQQLQCNQYNQALSLYF